MPQYSRAMVQLMNRFRPILAYTALFSLFTNLLLFVPALYMLQVYDRVLTSRSEETLILLSVGAAIALVVMFLFDLLRARLLVVGSMMLDKWLGPTILQHLFSLASTPQAESRPGMRDIEILRAFLTGPGTLALLDAPWVVVFVAVIFLFHPLLGFVALIGALTLLAVTVMNERMTRQPIEAMQRQARETNHFIELGLRNAEVVAAHGMAGSLERRWQERNDRVLERQQEATYRAGFMSSLTKGLRQFLQVAMLGAGAYLVIDQHISGGVMIAATILLGRALAPVELLIAGWKGLVEARGALRRLDELLSIHEDVPTITELPPPQGNVSVERVIFGVRREEKPVLKGISFELGAGEALGIIGPTASGKSTLARLIVGAWKPSSGTIRIDGADLSNWPRERIGPYMGYVPQDVELFAGTIAENICRMGEMNSEAVIEAAERANAHEMILRLPKGYDTQVGEGGMALAGGQRQRIALARTLYGKPSLVVLDEPSSNLDAEGEEALIVTLQRLRAEKVTLILITHKPSLLVNCHADKLLVLKEGAQELFGPFAEILGKVTRAMPASASAV